MLLEIATLLTPEVVGAVGAEEPLNWGMPNFFAILTLALLEIVLGVDNIVFIAIVSERAPAHMRKRVMRIGLIAGAAMRLLLLFSVSWLMGLNSTLFKVLQYDISGKDLVLLVGGGFLLVKSTLEIHHMIAAHGHDAAHGHADPDAGITRRAAMKVAGGVILQIMLIDLVFSLDSVITAVGMTKDMWGIVIAIVIAVAVMLFAAGPVASFVQRFPAMKTLALAFLIMIGVLLIADGLGEHLPRGYVYFAMVFSIAVELVNMQVESKSKRAKAAQEHA